MRDPVATIRAAYERMDREFTDDYAELIREYLAKKPRSKAGAHRYTPEEWGFELGAMREEARPYTDHFKVELED